MIKILIQSLIFHWDAHRSNPWNFFSACLGMVLNNLLFLYGIYLMLFAGKNENSHLLPYLMALWGIVATSWGILNFMVGGLRNLSQAIEDGAIEPAMGSPRNPLVLLAISESHPMALGDVIQGLGTILLLPWVSSIRFMMDTLFSVGIVMVAFAGVFVMAGALCFYIPRGSHVANFIIESTLSLSSYPTGKTFSGYARWILLLSPAFLTSIFPMMAIEEARYDYLLWAAIGACLYLALMIFFFHLGIKRYQSGNYIGFMK